MISSSDASDVTPNLITYPPFTMFWVKAENATKSMSVWWKQSTWMERGLERTERMKTQKPSCSLWNAHFHSSPEKASIQLFLLIFFFVLSLHERKRRNKSAKRNNRKILVLSPSISYLSINMSSLFPYQNINQLPLLQILFFSLPFDLSLPSSPSLTIQLWIISSATTTLFSSIFIPVRNWRERGEKGTTQLATMGHD